jgi:hypothetical protein
MLMGQHSFSSAAGAAPHRETLRFLSAEMLQSKGNRRGLERLLMPKSVPGPPVTDGALASWAGALGFRDFPGLLAAKENRNGSRRTLPSFFFIACSAGSLNKRRVPFTNRRPILDTYKITN